MESIEKLREYEPHGYSHEMKNHMKALADEIEREIAERYMELPLDADGVPIHMGDSVEGELLDDSTVSGTVCAFHIYDDDPDTVYINVNLQGGWTIKELRLTRCRHVKPDPVKELLEEFAKIGIRIGASEPIPANLHMYPDEEVIDEFVKRIRQAVE